MRLVPSRLRPAATALLLALALLAPRGAGAQQDRQVWSLETRVAQVEQRIADSERDRERAAGAGALAFLFGAFCALWAQNTRRNAWAWFIGGALFSVVAVLLVLVKNAADRRDGEPPRREFDLNSFRTQ